MSQHNADVDVEELDRRSCGTFPGMVGLEAVRVDEGVVSMRLVLRSEHLAPNGFLHGAVVVALADTACGYGTSAHLPQGASNFTTVELKPNYLGTVDEGAIVCTATPAHLGRSTQVWEIRIEDPAGKLVCISRLTVAVIALPGKPLP